MSDKNEWLDKYNKRKQTVALWLGRNTGRVLTTEAAEFILKELDQAKVHGYNERVEDINKKFGLK